MPAGIESDRHAPTVVAMKRLRIPRPELWLRIRFGEEGRPHLPTKSAGVDTCQKIFTASENGLGRCCSSASPGSAFARRPETHVARLDPDSLASAALKDLAGEDVTCITFEATQPFHGTAG